MFSAKAYPHTNMTYGQASRRVQRPPHLARLSVQVYMRAAAHPLSWRGAGARPRPVVGASGEAGVTIREHRAVDAAAGERHGQA
jgi:hypothetical protein